MARGVRKTTLEKLQMELKETQESIRQYEENLKILKEQEQNLFQQIELQEFKTLKLAMDEYGLTLEDVKNLIDLQTETRQSA